MQSVSKAKVHPLLHKVETKSKPKLIKKNYHERELVEEWHTSAFGMRISS